MSFQTFISPLCVLLLLMTSNLLALLFKHVTQNYAHCWPQRTGGCPSLLRTRDVVAFWCPMSPMRELICSQLTSHLHVFLPMTPILEHLGHLIQGSVFDCIQLHPRLSTYCSSLPSFLNPDELGYSPPHTLVLFLSENLIMCLHGFHSSH